MSLPEPFDPVIQLIAENFYPYRGDDPGLRERHYRVIKAALRLQPEILTDDIAAALQAYFES